MTVPCHHCGAKEGKGENRMPVRNYFKQWKITAKQSRAGISSLKNRKVKKLEKLKSMIVEKNRNDPKSQNRNL